MKPGEILSNIMMAIMLGTAGFIAMKTMEINATVIGLEYRMSNVECRVKHIANNTPYSYCQ